MIPFILMAALAFCLSAAAQTDGSTSRATLYQPSGLTVTRTVQIADGWIAEMETPVWVREGSVWLEGARRQEFLGFCWEVRELMEQIGSLRRKSEILRFRWNFLMQASKPAIAPSCDGEPNAKAIWQVTRGEPRPANLSGAIPEGWAVRSDEDRFLRFLHRETEILAPELFLVPQGQDGLFIVWEGGPGAVDATLKTQADYLQQSLRFLEALDDSLRQAAAGESSTSNETAKTDDYQQASIPLKGASP